MSEPDRFDEEARELFDSMSNERDEWTRNRRIGRIAAALRRADQRAREEERARPHEDGAVGCSDCANDIATELDAARAEQHRLAGLVAACDATVADLTLQNARLREALDRIAKDKAEGWLPQHIARRALEKP